MLLLPPIALYRVGGLAQLQGLLALISPGPLLRDGGCQGLPARRTVDLIGMQLDVRSCPRFSARRKYLLDLPASALTSSHRRLVTVWGVSLGRLAGRRSFR